jgi:catechol 2,3-dioxygenase-like lactoylglutathione lyase family enzyme
MRTTLVAVAIVVLAACSGDPEPAREHPLVAMAKACHGGELSCPRPIITVDSLRASQAYYRDKLGFTIDWDHGDPPDFGAVSRGDYQVFLCQRCQGHPGAWSMTFVRDVDKLHEELVRRGAIIQMPPSEMPWGLREMQVADPDGNVIRFGAPGKR